MADNLVIVESPAKAKTIEKILGNDFKVTSSYGHISDLPSKELAVDVENNFSPKYIVPDDKKETVKTLKNLVSKSKTVWLASDEDREGEAIAWHLFRTLNLKESETKRIVFHEITSKAILNAVENPRTINIDLVNAQQARRVLDRLVGYRLSPILWKKIKPGLSAGRVQSVAVRLIVEQEKKILNFVPTTSYKTSALFVTSKKKQFKAILSESFEFKEKALEFLELNKYSVYTLESKETKAAKKSPAAPFTTSTLQQEASRKLYFSVSRTMQVAQRLYEQGFITYMRTDSVSLSGEARSQAAKNVEQMFGKEYVKSRNYTNKNKNAQEAHEAIRPTDMSKMQVSYKSDEQRLYELIWKRTMASQMSDAQLERTTLKVKGSNFKPFFVAKGEVILFDGFLKLYIESNDDESDEASGLLPNVTKGEIFSAKKVHSIERFSKPVPRFTEASLVKKLEELGIGRPSTYAPTISTIQNRGYIYRGDYEGHERPYSTLSLMNQTVKEEVLKEVVGANKNKLVPSDIGFVVNDFLVKNFNKVLDFGFTAKVEEDFDAIASGNADWIKMMGDFYNPFVSNVTDVDENAARESGERILGKDPKSNRVLKVRLGKFGPIAQIGDSEDDEAPVYASLLKEQKLSTITFDQALKLFELPREVCKYKEKLVQVSIGRFGPYIKYDDKFISLPKGVDVYSVEEEVLVQTIKEKELADMPISQYDGLPVTKGKGRFGPYLKWNNLFINVSSKYDFDNLLEEEIITLVKEKIQKEKEKVVKVWEEEGIRIEKSRWKRHVIIHNKSKVEISKDVDVTKITLAQAQKYLEKVKPKKKATRKAKTKKAKK